MKILTFIALIFSFTLLFSGQITAQSPTEMVNPVVWKTAYNEFSSSNFYINVGGKRFYGNDNIKIHTDPGLDRTTLEIEWSENGVRMRLYFYFKKTANNMWEMYDLRTYNATGSDWVSYQTKDSLGNSVTSFTGQRDYQDDRTFLSQDGQDQIYCKGCSLTAFMNQTPPPSIYGYAIDFRIGLSQNETITVSTDPMTGYGVNAVLLDQTGNLVKDQSDFTYNWKAENSSTIAIQYGSVPYPDGNCAYGVLTPCPDFNIQVRGLAPGVTRVLLAVVRKSDKAVVASNAFSVKVVEKMVIPSPTTTPVITEKPTPTSAEIDSQLKELKGEVGRLSATVNQQQADIGIIQRLLRSLQELVQKLFGAKLE